MTATQRAPSAGNNSAPVRRRYDSPVRRQQAAETRARILAAGSALVHGYPTWDWRELTFRAVAEKAIAVQMKWIASTLGRMTEAGLEALETQLLALRDIVREQETSRAKPAGG